MLKTPKQPLTRRNGRQVQVWVKGPAVISDRLGHREETALNVDLGNQAVNEQAIKRSMSASLRERANPRLPTVEFIYNKQSVDVQVIELKGITPLA
jgi:hypothetical protein